MPSTYTTNNGIEKIGSGEQAGTWDDTTNTNFDLIDEALDGQVTVTLGAVGTSGSPNTIPITDGASSNGRNRFITFNDGGDLGGTAFVQLTPNDAEKIIFAKNSLSGGRSILIFQGTYNASNDYELANGETAILAFNGAGAGATVTQIQPIGSSLSVTTGSFGTLTTTGNFVFDGTTHTGTTGTDTKLVSGTAGSANDVAMWNGDGDIVSWSGGKQTVWLPASAFTQDNTSSPAIAEDSTGSITQVAYDFDASTDEALCFIMSMPKSWNESTLTAKFYWKDATTAGTGNVVWGISMLALGDSDAMSASFGTAQTVTDAFITSGDIHITSETASITAAGTPASEDMLAIRVYRDADNGSDTYTQDARLFGVKILYTVNAAIDD